MSMSMREPKMPLRVTSLLGLRQALDLMKDKESFVFCAYYGIPQTLGTIGFHLGVSRTTAAQIRDKAVSKLWYRGRQRFYDPDGARGDNSSKVAYRRLWRQKKEKL